MSIPKKETILMIFAYLLTAVIFTYPLIIHLTSLIYAQPGDPYGLLHSWWWGLDHKINYLFPAAPLFTLVTKILTLSWGSILTYNLLVLISFALTGLAGYLLIRKIVKNHLAAFWGGLVLMLAPFRLAHSLQHLNFSDLSGILFFIYFLLSAKKNPNFRNIFLAGLFFTLTTLWNYQYGFFAGVILLVFVLFHLVIFIYGKFSVGTKTNWKMIFYSSLVMVLFTFIIGIFTFNAVKDTWAIQKNAPTKVVPVRSKDELRVYSAQWFNYILPSPENPIFGKYTKPIYDKSIKETGSNLTEQTLYLGIIPLLLLLYCFITILLKKSQIANRKSQILFFTILGLVGLYFSFAPTVNLFGLAIKTPAYYIFDHLPFFRVYARFGLLVMISAAVLAGIGFSFLLEKISAKGGSAAGGKSKKVSLFLCFLVSLLVLAEFINVPPFHTIDVSRAAMPNVYRYLEQLPKGLVAEYPLLPSDEPKSYDYLLWQRYHQMPLLYGSPINSESDKLRRTMLDPQNPETIDALQKNGVRYLIIHQDRYTAENAKKYPAEYNGGVVPKIKSDKLELAGEFGEDVVYKIKD